MTHYERLGIDHSATPELIRQAFRRKALRMHPDLNRDSAGTTAAAHAEFIELSNAYRALIDPRRRALYDRELLLQRRAAEALPPRGPVESYDPKPYYAVLDEIRERVWTAPLSELVSDTLLHAGLLLLSVPAYIVLLLQVFAMRYDGLDMWRVLAGSLAVLLLGVWSSWQLAVRVPRIRAAGGFRHVWRWRRDRRRVARPGSRLQLGWLPVALLAMICIDAVLIVFAHCLTSGPLTGLAGLLMPAAILVWIGLRRWRTTPAATQSAPASMPGAASDR